MTLSPGELLKEATVAHFQAEKRKSQAVLAVYFENPVGIGEHSDLLEETVKHVEALANATDCLEALEQL
jgi:hypothetical protein